MAHYEEVFARLRESGVRIEQNPGVIHITFPPNISRESLVGMTADILSSEGLPFNGGYGTMEIKDGIYLMLNNNDRFRSRVPVDVAEAIVHVKEFGLPVKIQSSFVLGGWERMATTEAEVEQLVKEGQNLSPVGEVRLLWKIE